MGHDELYDDPRDQRTRRAYARARLTPEVTQPDAPERLARDTANRAERGTGFRGFRDWLGTLRAWLGAQMASVRGNPTDEEPKEAAPEESFAAVGRHLLQSIGQWTWRQITTHVAATMSVLLILFLVLALCSNLDRVQAVFQGGIFDLLPGHTVAPPFGQRFDGSGSAKNTPTIAPSSTPTNQNVVQSQATPDATPTAPVPTAAPTSAAAPTPTPTPQPPARTQTTLSGWIDFANYGPSVQGSISIPVPMRGAPLGYYECLVWINLPGAHNALPGVGRGWCQLALSSPSSLPAGAAQGEFTSSNGATAIYYSSEAFSGNNT